MKRWLFIVNFCVSTVNGMMDLSDVECELIQCRLRQATEPTTLHLMCSKGDFKGVCKELQIDPNDDCHMVTSHPRLNRSHRIDVHIDSDEGTPLYFACKNGHQDIVELLLKIKEVDVNAGSFETPLFVASTKEIARLLIAHGACIDIVRGGYIDEAKKEYLHKTPLITHILKENYDIAGLLIDFGADITYKHYLMDNNALFYVWQVPKSSEWKAFLERFVLQTFECPSCHEQMITYEI